MALIVETGAIVAGANTYATVATVRAYAVARGITLSAVDADVEVLIIKAMDYIESFSGRFMGTLMSATQPLSWPRSGAYRNGETPIDSDEIPADLIAAECAVVIELAAGADPYNPAPASLPVVSERAEGAVTVQYASPSAGQISAAKSRPVTAFLSALLRPSGAFAVRA